MYVFNFDDDRGFAVASGDSRVQPVFCITSKGSLNKGDSITHPGLVMAFSRYDTYYRMSVGLPIIDKDGNRISPEEYGYNTKGGVEPDNPYLPGTIYEYSDWENYGTTGAIIDCHWDQDDPFNAECYTTLLHQQAVVGCVPIAVAIVMYYWGKKYTYDGTYWDWDKMHQVKRYNSTPSDSLAWPLVQHLLYTLGKPSNLDVSYGQNSSSANSDNIPRTFLHFGYASGGTLQNYSFSVMRDSIAARPVSGRGSDLKTVKKVLGIVVSTTYTGHCWVFDQLLTRRRLVQEYHDGIFYDDFFEYQNFVHINWGWGGYCDGYFLANASAFDCYQGQSFSRGTTTYGTEGYYQYNLEMNCKIKAD